MIVTQWFDSDTKPIHVGVYETIIDFPDGRIGYSLWDGHQWRGQWTTMSRAEVDIAPGWQAKHWRGVMNEQQ